MPQDTYFSILVAGSGKWLMTVVMAGKSAGVGSPRIGDGKDAATGDDVHVKVDEPLAGDGSAGAGHAVRNVADKARKTVVDVPRVLAKARVATI